MRCPSQATTTADLRTSCAPREVRGTTLVSKRRRTSSTFQLPFSATDAVEDAAAALAGCGGAGAVTESGVATGLVAGAADGAVVGNGDPMGRSTGATVGAGVEE